MSYETVQYTPVDRRRSHGYRSFRENFHRAGQWASENLAGENGVKS